MFDMFKGGDPDAITLMAVDYEEREAMIEAAIADARRTIARLNEDDTYDISHILRAHGLDPDMLTKDERIRIIDELT